MRSLCCTTADVGCFVEDNILLNNMCLDLLNSCLTFEPSARMSAKEAWRHLRIIKDFELSIPLLTGSSDAGLNCPDQLHSVCQNDAPPSMEVQQNFLESLENSRYDSFTV